MQYKRLGVDCDGVLLAYLAGNIDSDGSITIKQHKQNGNFCFVERISLSHITKTVPVLLQKTFGGSLRTSTSKNRKQLFSWEVSNKKASSALLLLIPFLRVKKDQALICLRLRALKGSSGNRARSVELTATMTNLYAEIKTLNKWEAALCVS